MTAVTMSKRTRSAHPDSVSYMPLKNRADFLRLRNGKAAHSKLFVMQGRKRKASCSIAHPRLGFTVTKKNGNAVQRNRIKRRLREAAKLSFVNLANSNFDYAIIAKPVAISCSFATLVEELRAALNSLKQKTSQSTNA